MLSFAEQLRAVFHIVKSLCCGPQMQHPIPCMAKYKGTWDLPPRAPVSHCDVEELG